MSFGDLLKTYRNKPTSQPIATSATLASNEKHHPAYESMKQLWESRQATPGCSIPTNADVNQMSIGVLLMIIDDLPHEAIWRLWSRAPVQDPATGSSDCFPSCKFWIHAKYPDKIRSPWVQERLVKSFHLKPEWGSIEISKVMINLLGEAIADDASISKFCFASESCIPITSLPMAVSELGNHCNSWINYGSEPTNGYALQQQFEVLRGRLPSQCIQKADQWTMLSRQHAAELVSLFKDYPMWPLFNRVKASDEMVIPCGLSLLGFIQASGGSVPASVSGRSVERKRLTYVDWTEGGPSPASFFDLTAPLLAAGRGEGCLFLRKLKLPDTSKVSEEAIHRKKIDLSTIWTRLVLGIDVLGADLSGAITQADIEHLVTDSRSLSSATMANYRRTRVDAFPAHIQRTSMDQARIARNSDRGRERSGDRGRERSGDRGRERSGDRGRERGGDLGIDSYRDRSWEARKERKWEGSGERGQGRNRSRERSRERHQRRADSHTER